MPPESLPSAFLACAHPAFQMPATTAAQESWVNPFSTHAESRRFVSLQTKIGCRSMGMAPRRSVDVWELRGYARTTCLSKWKERQKTRASETSSRTFYPFRSLVQLNLLPRHCLMVIEHLLFIGWKAPQWLLTRVPKVKTVPSP